LWPVGAKLIEYGPDGSWDEPKDVGRGEEQVVGARIGQLLDKAVHVVGRQFLSIRS
jgi:hypothetical protein